MTTDNTIPTPDLSQGPGATGTSTGISSADTRTWSALAHFGGILSIVGPLIVWLMYRDRSTAVTREAKESLNFQIAVTLVAIVLYVLGGALALVAIGFIFIAIAPLVQLVGVVFAIIGGVRAHNTGAYRYPLTIRIIR